MEDFFIKKNLHTEIMQINRVLEEKKKDLFPFLFLATKFNKHMLIFPFFNVCKGKVQPFS